MNIKLKAPFPYFGGKSYVSEIIWKAFGQPSSYIEPFFGSGAVLLNRPDFDPTTHTETICDADGHIANVWRALQFSPDETAKWADWPVNHADLTARKKFLNENTKYLLENLIKDDIWHDTKIAGYWIWAASCWIGSGLTCPTAIPYIGNAGIGVHKISQIPHISNAGRGVQDIYNENIYKWFRSLSERLRYVRVVCGDWSRVCGGNWQNHLGPVAIFFDPPYENKDRDNVYSVDCYEVAKQVREWAIKRGGLKNYKICIAGYDANNELSQHGWTNYSWSTGGGYSMGSGGKNANCDKEQLWFSPNCNGIDKQNTLF